MLKANAYRLQAHKKRKEGAGPPDRDAQFRHISPTAKKVLDAGAPGISVAPNQTARVGHDKNNGHTWRPKGEPTEVTRHDFPDTKLGKAIPYGGYTIGDHQGDGNGGIAHDTGAYAVASVKRWWEHCGKEWYGQSQRLLISADSGGSHGYRLKQWQTALQAFSDDTGLAVTVCPCPSGTSQWNTREGSVLI